MKNRNNSLEKNVPEILNGLKTKKTDLTPLPVYKGKRTVAYLRPLTIDLLNNPSEIELLANWRKTHEQWFPAQFKVTIEGTKKWFLDQVINTEDRILFMLETLKGLPIGHMGLFRFSSSDSSIEVDNVLRGKSLLPGVMTSSLITLTGWAFKTLGIKILYLRVFHDNIKAVKLYKRCGFKEHKKIPLKKITTPLIVKWEEGEDSDNVQRYYLQMKLMKPKDE